MRIEREPFYYFSYEFYEPVFPVKCYFVKWLDGANSTTRALIARSDAPFGHEKLSECVLLPKGEHSFAGVPDEGIFPIFVFAIDDRVQGDTFDLSGGLKHVRDWACICFSLQFARSRALTS
jgi:hypothetical protein